MKRNLVRWELSALVIVGVMFMKGCIQNQLLDEELGTLQGTVTIGPLCPVEPCNLPPEQIAPVYQARKVMVYEREKKTKRAETHLNANGDYSLTLTPGSYIVDISDAAGNELPLDLSKRPGLGNATPQSVEIQAGETVVVNFDIDTGIR